MENVTIHQAKTNLSKLIERACSGEEIVISRGSHPVVRLVPLAERAGNRKPGRLKGKLEVGSEFFRPLPEEEVAGWE